MSVLSVKAFARRPGDTEEQTFSKALVLVVALSCCGCGLVWSLLYWSVFGTGLTMALPLAFVAIVGGTIVFSALIRDHRPLIYAQLACITWISALIQWSIGSAADSGLVICWSFLGPIGALMFLSVRRAAVWMAMFLLIVVLSAIVDPALQGAPLPVSDRMRGVFLVMNLGTASLVVFAAASWFVHSIQKALADLKEAQIQIVSREKQAVVGRLVSGILHEMNTPLGAIRSSTDTMSKSVERCGEFISARADEGTPEGKRALRAVKVAPKLRQAVDESVARLSSVIDGLSNFASLDEAEQKPVNVRESLDASIALLGDAMGDRIQVDRRYDEDLPEVRCFPARLNQVLLSVLQNAVHAMDGRGTIRVTATRRPASVALEITDTGRGIPASQLPHLFDVGFTQRAGRVGMQLGLPMSKRHIDEIGGRIDIESTEGDGTTVRIELPSK